MQIGTLVKHVEFEYIGIVTKQRLVSTCDKWFVVWTDDVCRPNWNGWCSECELEVLCK